MAFWGGGGCGEVALNASEELMCCWHASNNYADVLFEASELS